MSNSPASRSITARAAWRADVSTAGDTSDSGAARGRSRKTRAGVIFRWLHIYVSMASFGILFFFAVTGLTLNHADWFFSDQAANTKSKGTVPIDWVKTAVASVAKLEGVEHLRREHGVRGLLGEFRVEDERCSASFRGPGYAAEALVDRATGAYELSVTRMGFVAVINDLHKGRDSGAGWSLVVDLSAILMIVVSVTGLVLILFLRRHLVNGLLIAATGALLSALAYLWLVP